MKKFKLRHIIITLGLIAIISILSFSSYSLAKYTWNSREDITYAASDFYFTSDLLQEYNEGSSLPTYSLQHGITEISFNIKNHADALRVSQTDISYTAVLLKNGSQQQSLYGDLLIAEKQENLTFSGLAAGTYVVEVQSTKPYSVTLSAEFIITERNNTIDSEIIDSANSITAELVVYTNDYSGNIAISWPADVLPDNTNPLFAAASGTSHTITVNNNTEYTFVFFKNNPNTVYSLQDFTITKV